MRKTKGFTLIELLVVIAIIGLLSTLAVVALNNARSKGRDAKRVSDIKSIQTALELHFADNNEYPIETAEVVLGSTTGYETLSSAGFAAAVAEGETTYMGQVPANPTPGGTGYAYQTDTPGENYVLEFTLEEATGDFALGANCAQPSGITAGACGTP